MGSDCAPELGYRQIRFGKKWCLRALVDGDKLSRRRVGEEVLDAIEDLERQINQAQLVWSLRCRGLGVTQIEAELRGYPPGMRMTRGQIRYFFNPEKFKLRSRRNRAMKDQGE